ncbi:MAG: hypothetical protein U0893_13675 [Chloroflexota bacterium]
MDRPPPAGSGPFTPTEPIPRVAVRQDDVTVEDARVLERGPLPPSGGRAPKTPRAMLALMAALIAIALYWWFSQTQRAEEVALNATVTAVNQATATAEAANAVATVAQATAQAQATTTAASAAAANATAAAQAASQSAAAEQARATAQAYEVQATVVAAATQAAPPPPAPPTVTPVVVVVTATPAAPVAEKPTQPSATVPPPASTLAPPPPLPVGQSGPSVSPAPARPAPPAASPPAGSAAPLVPVAPAASPASVQPVPRGGASTVTASAGRPTELRCLDDRVQVTAGPDALPPRATLTCLQIEPGSVPTPPGPILSETVFQVTTSNGDPRTLPAPLDLTVAYPAGAVPSADRGRLSLAYLDGMVWKPLPDQHAEPDATRVSATIDRAGMYVLYRQP